MPQTLDWLVNSETYSTGFFDMEDDSLAESKVRFTTHCPMNQEFIARCHAVGIRCFPYVTFYPGCEFVTYPGASGSSEIYQGIRLLDHPEFIVTNQQGDRTPWVFADPTVTALQDGVGVQLHEPVWPLCPNVKAYQDAMVQWVTQIMDLAADGIFLDNVFSTEPSVVPCYGPHFGKHQHIDGSDVASVDDQMTAFSRLLRRAHRVVKSYRPRGAILANTFPTANIPDKFWKYLDAGMLESYICQGGGAPEEWVTNGFWGFAHDQGTVLHNLVASGKAILALSNLPFNNPPQVISRTDGRDHAFFCYATARLAGFVWNGGKAISYASPVGDTQPYADDLYRLRLGKSSSGEILENGVYYRIFEAGLVAVNPTDTTRTIAVGQSPSELWLNIFDRTLTSPGQLAIPAYSGRVYRFVPSTTRELI